MGIREGRTRLVVVGAAAVVLIAVVAGGAIALLGRSDERGDGKAPPAPAEPIAVTRRDSPTSPLRDAGPIAADLKKCRGMELTSYGTCVAVIGDTPDVAIAALTERAGAPDRDTDWVDAARSPFGSCPGMRVRGVTWKGLTLVFAEGSNLYNAGARQELIAWRLEGSSPAPYKTRAGMTIGDTVEQLREKYGKDRVTLGKVGDERRVDIHLPPQPMRGILDGDTISALEGGATCSRHE